MKLIVQPPGETMHVPAETAFTDTPSVPAYGGEVPTQFGSSVAAGTSIPRGPAAMIFASSCGVSQLGLGRSSVVGAESSVVAPATVPPRAATRNAAAITSATRDLCIRVPLPASDEKLKAGRVIPRGMN